jgi:serine/threonine protein kinase
MLLPIRSNTPRLEPKKNPPASQVQLFKNDIIVESSSSESAQATVFFGRDATLLIRVVLKQYAGVKKKAIMTEVKVFTLLEQARQQESGNDLANVLSQHQISLKGLPLMLGYKVSKQYSEILMTHGGDSLEHWLQHINNQQHRIGFAAEMLRQILHAIKSLHAIGYSHGDIKPENICARTTKENKVKFSLIDFGLCQKLPKQGESNTLNKSFRGNYMFCSDQ